MAFVRHHLVASRAARIDPLKHHAWRDVMHSYGDRTSPATARSRTTSLRKKVWVEPPLSYPPTEMSLVWHLRDEVVVGYAWVIRVLEEEVVKVLVFDVAG